MPSYYSGAQSIGGRFFSVPWWLIGLITGWRLLLYAQTFPAEVSDPLLRKLISGLVIFVVLAGVAVKYLTRRQVDGDEALEPGGHKLRGDRLALAGGLSLVGGFVTMLTNNSAPVWVVYLMLFRLPKFFFLGTVSWLVFFINATKLPFALHLGYVNLDTLGLNIFMMPFLIVGVVLGRIVAGRISQKFFDNLTQIIALLSALYLVLTS